jgi:hypothetical protein
LASKEYSYKYTFGKSIFENTHQFSINDPLWHYLTNSSGNEFSIAGEDINKSLFKIGSGLCTKDAALLSAVNGDFTQTVEKKYSAGVGISKDFKLPAPIFGLDVKVGFNANLFVEGKYPLGESHFQGSVNSMLPVVKYEDIEKAAYWFSPAQRMDELWNNIVKSVTNFGGMIAEKAKEYWSKFTAMFTSDDNNDKTLTNVQKARKYAKSLANYHLLREKAQTNISTFRFILPGNNKAFELNTSVDLEYFYPGGSLLGATTTQDTFIVISDVFYLRAYHGTDTLSEAPLGNFKVYATVGEDDLSFLDINSSYPVSVYYQPLTSNVWEKTGAVNDTISTNRLGIYCLGISVNSDKEAPNININKADTSRRVDIMITDNMAVAWKKAIVLVNGLVTEYNRNGNTLSVDLKDEQLDDEVYVTVYAFDLANNESQESAVFGKTQLPGTGIIAAKTSKNTYCKIYPNPVADNFKLFISKELLDDSPVKYAIVSPLGQVSQTGFVLNEETLINVNELASGIYFMVVYNDNRIISNQKLIKRKK